MEKTVFRVYGRDTFAGETFVVGVYGTRAEADAMVERCEASVMHQCQELRDSFWVSEMNGQELDRALRREEEERKARLHAKCLDAFELSRDVERLLADIRHQLASKHLMYAMTFENMVHDAESEIENTSENVCYRFIIMYVDSCPSGNSSVNVEVYANGYKISGTIKFFRSEETMRCWLGSCSSVEDSARKIAKLIADL